MATETTGAAVGAADGVRSRVAAAVAPSVLAGSVLWSRVVTNPRGGLVVVALGLVGLSWAAPGDTLTVWALAAATVTVGAMAAQSATVDKRRVEEVAHALDDVRRKAYQAKLLLTAGEQLPAERRSVLAAEITNSLAHHARLVSQDRAEMLGQRIVSGEVTCEELDDVVAWVSSELGERK